MVAAQTAENQVISRAAFQVMAGGVFSLLVGLVNQVAIAAWFGAGSGMDAYLTALVVPAYLEAVLLSGLSFVFIPAFVGEMANGREDDAWSLVGTFFWLTSLVLTGVALVGVWFAPRIVALSAPGLSPQTGRLSAQMLAILMLATPFSGLGVFTVGVQNAGGRFFWPALGGAINSLVSVIVLLGLARWLGPLALAWAYLAATIVQSGVTVLPVARHGWRRRLPLHDRRVGELAKLILPFLLFGLLTRGGSLFERYFASGLPSRQISYLGYGHKLAGIFVTLLASGIASAIFPAMARAYAQGERSRLGEKTAYGLQLTLAVGLPAVFIAGALALPLARSLFERGAFQPADSQAVAGVMLAVLASDVLCRMVSNILGRTFYVLKDTLTPPLVSAATALIYLGLGRSFAARWGYTGLAWAALLQQAAGIAVLSLILFRKLRPASGRGWGKRVWGYTGLAGLAFAAGKLGLAWAAGLPPIVQLAALGLACGALYLGGLYLLDREMLAAVIELFGGRYWRRARPRDPQASLKIVLFQYYDHPNPVYPALAEALRERGHSVWLARQGAAGELEWLEGEQTRLRQPGPNLAAIEGGARWLKPLRVRLEYARFLWRARARLRQLQPDIVQVNPASLHLVGLLPLFYSPATHFILDYRQVGQRRRAGWLGRLESGFKALERFVTCTLLFERACFLHPAGARLILGKNWARWAAVVPLGVEAGFLHCPARPPAGGPVRFVYSGTLSPARNLEVIFAAAQKTLQQTGGFTVSLLGPDASGGRYQRLARQDGLEAVVAVEPPVDYAQVPQALAAYDVALAYLPDEPRDWRYHPSLKALEYRALGLPILASRNPPNQDLVEPGINGLLSENTPEALSAAMLAFIQQPDFLRRCRQNAQHMRRGLLWSEAAQLYEQEVYRPLLQLDRI